MAKKFFQTADVKISLDPVKAKKLKPLSTHEAQGLSDRAFVEKHASAEDLAATRARIEARQAADVAAWQTTPGGARIPGNYVLALCTSPLCHFADFVRPGNIS